MFRFTTKNTDEALEVVLEGDLDIEGTEIIENELTPTITNYKNVKINFEQVPFVDSSGIGLLLTLVQTLTGQGTNVTILNVSEEVMEVFDILQIPEILGEGVFV
ncbi:STAS domain-containing protein [Bacillus seohaeanensis]|jgi:anti-anti-sigma factor|uniref:Anti-sigma factor antagonist n=1 Tax=Bacillus seohaeanensis TaxID=284580 RepID=A0ABW5RLJ9_9BACI